MAAKRLLFFVTEDYYFCSHRLQLAQAALAAGYEVSVLTRVCAHGDHIRRAGLKLIPFEINRSSLDPIGDLWMLIRLIRVYRRERPTIVHHVALKPVLYGSIAARMTGIRSVVNALAGMGWLFTSASGLGGAVTIVVRWFLRTLFKRGIVLVQNPDDARLLRQLRVSGRSIRIIRGSGVDLREFVPKPPAEGPPVVVLPARLLWDKGVGEFVEAARLVRRRGVAARFVMAGEPDLSNPSSLRPDQIAAWVKEGVVEHLGWVDDMPALLETSHIVCLPSFREGLPRALIEAAAAGLPIVTTDVPGCRDVVRDGDNGLVVPPRDATALATALVRLIDDPVLRRRMGARGRVRAEEEFGLEAVISETLALYKEALA